MEDKKPKNFKKLKYGSMAIVTTAIVVAIVVIINIMMGILTARYPIKVDLTKDKRYELCDETINILKGMEGDVEISVMYPKESLSQNPYYSIITSIFDKYEIYAKSGKGNIDIKYYDITKNPDVVTRYRKYYSGTIVEGSVVVYYNEKVKVSNIGDFFTEDNSESYYTGSGETKLMFVGESSITSAIISVTDATPPIRVGVLSLMNNGSIFDESDYNSVLQLCALLGASNYECEDIDVLLDSEKISGENYDMLLIPSPKFDFAEDIIEKIDEFLYNNGDYQKNILYVSGSTTTGLTNIDAFLAKWNIEVGDAYIVDLTRTIPVSLVNSAGYIGNSIKVPVGIIADEDAVGELPNASRPIVMPYGRPITILNKNNDVQTTSILQTSSSGLLFPFGADDNFNLDDAPKDALNYIAVSERSNAVGYDVFRSHIMVVGSAKITDPNIIRNRSTYNNADFILNIVNTMTGKENSVVIPQKNLEQQLITVNDKQLNALSYAVIYVIPGVIVICGVVVFIRRRNL